MYAQDSIELLTRAGIDFRKNEQYGIDPIEFGELLMASGLVLAENIKVSRIALIYSNFSNFIHKNQLHVIVRTSKKNYF